MLVQLSGRRQEGFTRLLWNGRDVCKVAMFQRVSGRRGAEKETGLSASLDKGGDLAVPDSLRKFLVALYGPGSAVDDVFPARGCALDNKLRQQRTVDLCTPCGVRLGLLVEIDALEVAGHRARDHAQRLVPV